ncbi:MAG: hypothetical protein WD894_00445 [Pirellulales bacterium]
MKRLALALVVLAFVALGGRAASADDWRLYRHHTYGHYDYRDHQRLHDELDHRAFHREFDHREAHRYPMTWRQHERLHDALDHDAFHDELDHRNYHRYHDVPRYAYGYPGYSTYRSYSYRPYGGYFNQPYGVTNFRPYSSRFGLSSPRWGVMYNMGY